MTLQELVGQADQGCIDALQLTSVEGGFYLLDIFERGGVRHRLCDAQGRACHLRSVEHARDLLKELPEMPFHLLHASTQDEMCGLPVDEADVLRVPIGLRSGW